MLDMSKIVSLNGECNLFDGIFEVGDIGYLNGLDATASNYDRIRTVNYIKVLPSSTFIIKANIKVAAFGLRYYDENKNFIGNASNNTKSKLIKITTPAKAKYLRFIIASGSTGNPYPINTKLSVTHYTPTTLPNGSRNSMKHYDGCVNYVKEIGTLEITSDMFTEDDISVKDNTVSCTIQTIKNYINAKDFNSSSDTGKILCSNNNLGLDNFYFRNYSERTKDEEMCVLMQWNNTTIALRINILKSKLNTSDYAGFVSYLNSNPIKLYYLISEITTEVYKTENIYKGILENGSISKTTGLIETSNTRIRSKDFARVIPSTEYKIYCDKAVKTFCIREYDKDKNFIGYIYNSKYDNTNQALFTTSSTTRYIKFLIDDGVIYPTSSGKVYIERNIDL